MLIDTEKLSVNLAAECLREFCFSYVAKSRYTPDEKLLRNGFYDMPPLKEKLIKEFQDYLPETPEEQQNISCYSYFGLDRDRIDVLWWHDGDCTLIIKDGSVAYVNSDAKKPYYWRKIVL